MYRKELIRHLRKRMTPEISPVEQKVKIETKIFEKTT